MAPECANPLLLGWLKEWMDEAQQRNSKGYTVYKKAYQSMKACPLSFNHPSEAQQLNGLGPKLCDRLAEKLRKYCSENGLPMPSKEVPQAKRRTDGDDPEGQPAKKARKTALYVPKLRSGAYALIMALAELDQSGGQALSKAELTDAAQPYCDASFTTPIDPTKFFTAWQSMKTLETKELVCTRGHPTKRYCLSDEGWEVAQRMKAAEGGKTLQSNTASRLGVADATEQRSDRQALDGIAPNSVFDVGSPEPEGEALRPQPGSLIAIKDSGIDGCRSSVGQPPPRPIVLQAGSFEVRMVLDTREIRTKNDRDYLSRELKKLDVIADIRALPLGDVLWVAKIKESHLNAFHRDNHGDQDEGSDEIVLEHVVERKRLDDLIGSIKDGRFHEQKFRLRKSGMRNVTYLIEDYSISAERSEKYGEAVESAIAAMQVVNDVFVKQTSKIDSTIQYLARMTKTLKQTYEQKDLHIIPSRTLDVSTYLVSLEALRKSEPTHPFCITFSAFSALCDKSDSMTLRDVYLKMLMCIRGITGDKAIEIQKIWNTPQALIEAYEALGNDTKKKECMISNRLSDTIPRKKVAKALSMKIAEVWGGNTN